MPLCSEHSCYVASTCLAECRAQCHEDCDLPPHDIIAVNCQRVGPGLVPLTNPWRQITILVSSLPTHPSLGAQRD
jgi:hypothetical protein